MRQKILNHIYFTGLFLVLVIYLLITIIGIVFNLFIPYPGSLTIGYIYMFFLLPIVGISFSVIFYKKFKSHSFTGTIKEMRVHVLFMIGTFFLLLVCHYSGNYFSNKIPVTITNHTNKTLYDIELTGREGIVQIDSLVSNDDVHQKFFGRDIIYKSSEDSINNIWLYYIKNGEKVLSN